MIRKMFGGNMTEKKISNKKATFEEPEALWVR